jgi:hypothetical protein
VRNRGVLQVISVPTVLIPCSDNIAFYCLCGERSEASRIWQRAGRVSNVRRHCIAQERAIDSRIEGMLSMHQSQRDNPTALLFAVVALIALAAWLSDVRGADARSLDLSDPVSAGTASGHRAGSSGRRRTVRSENSQVLEVPHVIDSPTANSAGDGLSTNREDTDGGLQLGPAGLDDGARQFFSGIAGPVGTVQDYES